MCISRFFFCADTPDEGRSISCGNILYTGQKAGAAPINTGCHEEHLEAVNLDDKGRREDEEKERKSETLVTYGRLGGAAMRHPVRRACARVGVPSKLPRAASSRLERFCFLCSCPQRFPDA